MDNRISELNFEFFSSQVSEIKNIRTSKKSKIDLVDYIKIDKPCIKKQYYNRNMSEVYKRLRTIHHKNISQIYEVMYYNQDTYIIEEYIEGQTLRQAMIERCKKHQLYSEAEVVDFMVQLCDALAVLHSQVPSMIHKDIKPENIMVQKDGVLKLIDFDATRLVKEEQQKDTRLLGTEDYASPEHFGYGQTDIRSDIYGIGVLIHELLTGQVLQRHQITYEGRLKEVLKKCVAIDPEQRYPSVLEVKDGLLGKTGKRGFLKNKRNPVFIASCIFFVVSMSLLWYQENKVEKEKSEHYLEEVSSFQSDKVFQGNESGKEILEKPYLKAQLMNLLGSDYDKFLAGIDTSVQFEYDKVEEYYYLSSTYIESYDYYASSIIIHSDGEIECGLFDNKKYYYYAMSKERYDSPSVRMLDWLVDKKEYPIVFVGQKEETDSIISGKYEGKNGWIHFKQIDDEKYSFVLWNKSWNDKEKIKGTMKAYGRFLQYTSSKEPDISIEIKKFYHILCVERIQKNSKMKKERKEIDYFYRKE